MSFLYPHAFILLLLLMLFKRYSIRELSNTNKMLFYSLIFSIVALSSPIYHTKIEDKRVINTQDVIIALDISYSMQGSDIKPNRLNFAKDLIKKLVTENKNSRFTLFAFTTSTLILSPPTTDYMVLLAALESLNEKFVLTHGTSFENLLKKISSLKRDVKNLIIFSDGGDERDLSSLLKIAKEGNIHIFSVAVATEAGTILKDTYAKSIKDSQGHIVISRLNPLFKELAVGSGGANIEIDEINTLMSKISSLKSYKHQKDKESRYIELFWIPLLIALGLFFFAFVEVPKKLLLMIPFLTLTSDAFILDWYYISKANKAVEKNDYNRTIYNLKQIRHKTMQSELNLAYCYYKNKNYKIALSIYNTLKSNDAKIKKVILFGKANTLAHLQEYINALHTYEQALAFGYDKDIYHNMNIVKKLIRKRTQALPNPFRKKLSKVKKKNTEDKKNKEGKNSNSKMEGEPVSGSSSSDSAYKDQKISKTSSSLSHPLSYKAYELINKGYINEKNPW